MNNQKNYSEGASIDTLPKVHQSPSTSNGFTNYFESRSTSQDQDVEVYSIFGELQKNLIKGIKVIQETKSSDLVVMF